MRRTLFGQSLVDFAADPWIGANSQSASKQTNAKKKTTNKQSRLEREFSQAERQSSPEMTTEKAPVRDVYPSREEMPSGTVYFSSDSSSFQDFSAFQKVQTSVFSIFSASTFS